MSASKAKGTAAETAVVNFMKTLGHWPYVERRALSGANDRGDIAGIPEFVVEVKAGNRLCIPEWMAETEAERVRDVARFGLLVVKPKGVGLGRVGDWWAIKPLWQEMELMNLAGY